MGAHAHDAALVQHDDAVGVPDGADALGHDEAGDVPQLPGKARPELCVGAVVQRGEGVVKDQDLRPAGQGPGDGKALLLPAGHVCAALGDGRVRAAGQLVHKLGGLGQVQRLAHRAVGLFAPAVAKEHVVPHGAREEHRLLGHIAHPVIEGVEGVVLHVHAVHQHFALGGVVEAGGKADQRGLAAAGGADEGHRLALFDLEIDVLQHVLARRGVAEGDVAELHRALLVGIGAAALGQAVLRVQHGVDALGGHLGRRHEHDDHDQHHDGHDDVSGIGAEHHHIAEGGQPQSGVGGGHMVHDGRAHPVDDQRQGVHGQVHRRHQEGEGALVEQLGAHQLLVALAELLVLVVLGVVGAHDADAVQVLPGHQVDVVGEFLHPAHPGHHHADDDHHHHQQRQHEARGDGREGPAFVDDLDDGPHRHDGRLDEDLQAHGHQHLHLGDVVGGAVDQAGHREVHHLLAAQVGHLVEHRLAQRIAEAGGHAGREIAANDAEHRAGQRAAQHLGAGVQDVGHGAARRFDEHRQVAHIVRQGQIEVDLEQDQHRAHRGHDPLPPAHVTK